MNVVIRADSSTNLGSGHVMRCLTLADGLSDKGANVIFLCQNLPGNLNTVIKERGYSVNRISLQTSDDFKWEKDAKDTIHYIEQQAGKPDWLVVDHYDLDSDWEKLLRPYTRKIMVIDDLADRAHDCDVLLDQNYYSDAGERYLNLVDGNCILALGPKYALLRKEFEEKRKYLKEKTGEVSRLFISLGAGDPHNLTSSIIDVLIDLQLSINIDVVIGKSNPHTDMLVNKCRNLSRVNLYIQIDNMSELMLNADFAIGAGGATSWERCTMGLPSLLISLADNQVRISEGLSELGCAFYFGKYEDITEMKLTKFITKILSDHYVIKNMIKNCINTVDAQGCKRVVSILEDQT